MGARSGSGPITLTFTGTSCPAAGTDAAYVLRVYETVTPTTYELAISNGTGTCVRGGAGTIVATGPTGTYTNATATSASSGAQEAIFSVADGLPVRVRVKEGGYYVYSDIVDETRPVTIACDSNSALFVPMIDNVSIINSSSPSGIRVYNCGFNNIYAKSGTKAIRTYNPYGDSFGSSISGNMMAGFSTCADLQTVYGIKSYEFNHHIDCTDTALFLSNVNTGDAGIGLIGPGNLFSDSVTANYGVNWNGPGNLKIKHNSFNGYIEQIHLEPKMGVVNVSGTSVTWVSGNRFRSTMAGGLLVAGSTVTSTIATYNSSTSLTLATSQPTCTGCSYYVNNTGQMQIEGNTLDSWTWTTHTVRFSGGIPFFNWQFQNNFTSNPNSSTYSAAVTVDGAGWYFGSIKGNNLQSSYAIGKAVNITAGNFTTVSDNEVVNHLTGVNVGSAAISTTVDGTKCANSNTTNCVLSASSTTIAREINSVTYTQLAALTSADSSTLYCSNCKRTSLASNTCTSGGSGARATRINGTWSCDDGAVSGPWSPTGSDIYFSGTGNVGIHGVPVADLSITGGGAGANSLLIQDGSATTTLQLFADSGFAVLGTYTAHPFIFTTDSVGRWRLTSAGMLHPETTDAYDIGLTSNRVRGLYARFGEFMVSGGTSSSDYVSTRKVNVCDNSGGSGCWDIQAGASMASTSEFKIRDNAGSRWLEGWRASLGSPLNFTSVFSDWIPAKRATGSGDAVSDSTFPKLGSTSAPWAEMHADQIYGDLKSSTTNTKKIQPDTDLTWDLGDPSKQYNALWVGSITATSNITFSARAIFSADQTIDFGTSSNRLRRLYATGWTTYGSSFAASGSSITIQSGATFTDGRTCSSGDVWTSDASGNLACAAPSGGGAWTTSGSDVYRSSGAVWVGKSTNNISAKLEVENSASVNLLQLKYTGSVSSISGGGISAHQGSLPTAADQRLGFMVFGAEVSGTQYNRAAIMAFSSQAWSTGSAEGEYLQFLTTNTGSTTRTARWRVDANGDWLPEAATSYSVGSNAARTLKLWTSALDASGAVTMSGSTITASSTFSSDLIATTGSTYALGSSSVRWLAYLNTVNINGTVTLNGSITGDLLFTSSNTYVLGSSTNYLNGAHVNTYSVYGQVKPGSGVTTADLGASTARFRKMWISDINANGTITAPDGNTGYSGTVTTRDSAGTGTCVQSFSGGILTGKTGTC
jgi:hypothetical protein